jgi:hypothetical protein
MAQRRQTPQAKFAQIKADYLKKNGGQSSLFPSSVPDRATKKALLALQSELRRLERTLQEREEFLKAYEQRLIERDQQLERDVADLEDCDGFECDEYECEAEERDECDCDHLDAEEGCECATCQFYSQEQSKRETPQIENAAGRQAEVDWLEKLFTLKDKRRKK